MFKIFLLCSSKLMPCAREKRKIPTALLLIGSALIVSCSNYSDQRTKNLIRLTPDKTITQNQCNPFGDVDPSDPNNMFSRHIYANKTAINYRQKPQKNFNYPVASKFYREEYSFTDTPHLATIMTKIANQGKMSDWQFSMISLPDGKALPFKEASGIRCHTRYEKRGFISAEGIYALDDFLKKN